MTAWGLVASKQTSLFDEKGAERGDFAGVELCLNEIQAAVR